MDVVEGFNTGERDTAVAGLTALAQDDLPSISRVKVAPCAIFTHRASDIAAELGLRLNDVSYLVAQKGGLDFVTFHPDLWDHDTFQRLRRRMWHPHTATLLAEIIDDADHHERENVTSGCRRILDRCVEARESRK